MNLKKSTFPIIEVLSRIGFNISRYYAIITSASVMEVNKKIITYHKFSLQEELFLTIECIKASNLRITATRATFAGLCLAIKWS